MAGARRWRGPARPGVEAGALASELRDELAQALATPAARSGAWVFDTDATATSPCSPHNASSARVPASNQKLFTTAAFLDQLGPEGRLETRAYADGKLGGAGDSVLDGDLVIVGDGDPAFGTARFARASRPARDPRRDACGQRRPHRRRADHRARSSPTPRSSTATAATGPYLSPLSGLSFNNGYDGG